MRILVLTKDEYLIRHFELELESFASVVTDGTGGFDAIIYDCDSNIPQPRYNGKIIRLSRKPAPFGCENIPLPRGKIIKLLSEDSRAPLLKISDSSCSAFLRGTRIKLTSHECALLSLLAKNRGRFTTREEIAHEVWNGASDGLINIYVHYLREKLEKSGERIILSSRGQGYKIDEKFLGGDL